LAFSSRLTAPEPTGMGAEARGTEVEAHTALVRVHDRAAAAASASMCRDNGRRAAA